MKTQKLQELVNKIFNDESTKAQFISNPESVISRYNLTELEKKAVLTVHNKLGLVTSDSSQFEAAINPITEWW
jgi:hypothetical protein